MLEKQLDNLNEGVGEVYAEGKDIYIQVQHIRMEEGEDKDEQMSSYTRSAEVLRERWLQLYGLVQDYEDEKSCCSILNLF